MSGNSQGSSSPSSRIDSSNTEPNGQDRGDAQRSLQQASVALEVAYNRIRQVRRSLLQLSESLPNPEGLTRSTMDYNMVRPGHDALLLSGGDFEGIEVDSELLGMNHRLLSVPPPPNSIPTTEHPITTRESGDSPGANHAFPELPTLFRPLPAGTVRSPRQSTRQQLNHSEVQLLARRGSNQDSAITTRGLRVAAREANAQDPAVDFLTYAAELDRILVRVRGAETGMATGSATNNIRAERQNRLQRHAETRDAQRATPAPTVSAIPPSSASWRAPDPRRWRMHPEVRTNARQFSIEGSERFQPLSNVLVPSHPPSNVPRAPLAPESRTTPPSGSMPEDQSLYRRYHEGLRSDDMASNVNIDWSDEDFISWLFPAQDLMQPSRDFPTLTPRPSDRPQNPDTIRVTRTTDTAVSPPENSPPRRGWARLDPDGNEISSNEEEELERSRTEYRLRALQRARQVAAAHGSDIHSEYPLNGLYRDYNGQRTLYGSVLDSTMTVLEGRRHFAYPHESDSTPLYVDPLPMPLASMVVTLEPPKQDDNYVDIVVPKLACLAGR